MAGRVELEELGMAIMTASVKAQFLGLNGVVDYLDMAFSDVVRMAEQEVSGADRAAAAVERSLFEGGVDGG